MKKNASIMNLSELPGKEPVPGAEGRFVHSEHMTLAYWTFAAGTPLAEHAHPHEQITCILDGAFELTIEGEPHGLEAGMVAVIPPNARHSGKSITECHLMDVFYPVREDFR